MRQSWLWGNRRIAAAIAIVGLLVAAVGGSLAAVAAGEGLLGVVGGSVLGLGLALVVVGCRGWFRPRLAYDGRYLLVYVKLGSPYRVPIEQVEVFFAGQTEANLPGRQREHWESRSVVVRIAQSARQWHKQPVAPRLGDWFGGYIVIRGVWCEAITKPKIEELNRKLVAAHREQRALDNRPTERIASHEP